MAQVLDTPGVNARSPSPSPTRARSPLPPPHRRVLASPRGSPHPSNVSNSSALFGPTSTSHARYSHSPTTRTFYPNTDVDPTALVEAPPLPSKPSVQRFDIARYQYEQVAIIKERYQKDGYYRYIANGLNKLPHGQSPPEPDPAALQICGITMRVVNAAENNGNVQCEDCQYEIYGEYVHCSCTVQGDEEQKDTRWSELRKGDVDEYDLCVQCSIREITDRDRRYSAQADGADDDRGRRGGAGDDQRRRAAERRLFAYDHFLKLETHKVKFVTSLISRHRTLSHIPLESRDRIKGAAEQIELQTVWYKRIDEALMRLLPTQIQRLDEPYQQICNEIDALNAQRLDTMRAQVDHLQHALELERARHDVLLLCRCLGRRQHIINEYYASVQNLTANCDRVLEISWDCPRCQKRMANSVRTGKFCPECGLKKPPKKKEKKKSWSKWTTAECVHQLQDFVEERGLTLTSMAQVCGMLKARHVTGDKLAGFVCRGALEAICIFDAKDQNVLLQWAEYVREL